MQAHFDRLEQVLVKKLKTIKSNKELGEQEILKLHQEKKDIFLAIISSPSIDMDKIGQTLKPFGLQKMSLSAGDKINTAHCEIIEIKKDASMPHGTVLEVIQPGYFINDEVLIKAQVVLNQLT